MRLFYTPATSSLLPHIMLHKGGFTFEKTRVDDTHTKLTGDGRHYTAINPRGLVPALDLDDGTLLTEGVAIAQYNCRSGAYRRHRTGTLARARLPAWLNFIAPEMHMGWFCLLLHATTSEVARMMYRDRLSARLDHINRHLAQHQYLLGARFSLWPMAIGSLCPTGREPQTSICLPAVTCWRCGRGGGRVAVSAAMQLEGLLNDASSQNGV